MSNGFQKVAAKVAGTSALAQTIAVPNLHKPLRLPTYPALERTAVLGFTDTTTYGVGLASTSSALLVRDPAYPLWVQRKLGNVASARSGTYFSGAFSILVGKPVEVPIGLVPSNITALGESDVVTPIVTHSGNFYWCMGGQCTTAVPGGVAFRPVVELTFADYVQLKEMTATFECVTADGELAVHTVTGGPTTSLQMQLGVVLDVPAGHFAARLIALNVHVSDTAAATASLVLVRSGLTTEPVSADIVQWPIQDPAPRGSTVLRLFPMTIAPEESQSIIWENTRANAVACLFKNVTSVMNKEGTVQAARVPARSTSLFRPVKWDFGAVHPRDRYFGALENGFYAYTLSDASSELFRDCHDQTLGINNLLEFPLLTFAMDKVEYGTIIVFEDMDPSSATTLAVTLDRHIEFRTTSRLFPTDYSKLRLEEYHSAQMALADMGTMFENPAHLATIARMALNAAKVAWPIVRPYVVSAATTLAGKALKKADTIAGNMGQAALVRPERQVGKRKPQSRKAKAKPRR